MADPRQALLNPPANTERASARSLAEQPAGGSCPYQVKRVAAGGLAAALAGGLRPACDSAA